MLSMITKEIIGQNIKAARLELGWNQIQLGKYSGVSQKTISNIETPATKPNYSPTIDVLERITRALKIPLSLIFLAMKIEDLRDDGLQNTINHYIHSTKDGRRTINSVAENAPHYDTDR